MKLMRIGFFVIVTLLAIPSWSADSVTVGNQEWLQPIDFIGYTYNQVSEVCPGRDCIGMLPGSDVNLDGYTWASTREVEQLFATYEILGKPILADFEYTHSDVKIDQILYAFLGNPRTESQPFAGNPDYVEYGVYTAAVIGDGVDPNEGRAILSLPSNDLFPEAGGAWFWRTLKEPPVEDQVDLHGRVTTNSGQDVCALVLSSGQFMFSCDPLGFYALEALPREADGTVIRQIYADGFFPKVEVLEGSTLEQVTLERATDCPDYNLPSDPTTVPQSSGKRHSISGRVLFQNTDMPVCALVLANGSHMFSCDGEGSFSLEFPLNENGQYTLQAYADGFAPSVRKFNEFDNPQEVRLARASECKEIPGCDKAISSNIVVVDGKEWLQPDLFSDFTRREIGAVCPKGVCSGTLPGCANDLTGYTWGSMEDLNALFNYYIGTDEMGPGPDTYDPGSGWMDAFFLDGWRPEVEVQEGRIIWAGLRDGRATVWDNAPTPHGPETFIETLDFLDSNGGWFWRPAK